MRVLYCPVCGMPVHMAAWIPLTAKCIADVWDIWFCDSCKWCSDWPGMPDFLKKPGWSKPITDPTKAERAGGRNG